MSKKELAGEIHKIIIKKIESRKLHSSFIDNIWSTDLVDIQLIRKSNKGICFFMCFWCFQEIRIGYFFKKYITIINVLQKILDESNRKPNKIRVDKGSEFCNRSMKSWLEKKRYRNVFNI